MCFGLEQSLHRKNKAENSHRLFGCCERLQVVFYADTETEKVVMESWRNRGVGKTLVPQCLQEKKLGLCPKRVLKD